MYRSPDFSFSKIIVDPSQKIKTAKKKAKKTTKKTA